MKTYKRRERLQVIIVSVGVIARNPQTPSGFKDIAQPILL